MGAFLSSVRLDFSHIFLLEMKKDQLGVLPNRSYHHIQRANCNFSSGIVAFARYFQLFLSVNIKRITQTLYQYLRDWMVAQDGFEPSTCRVWTSSFTHLYLHAGFSRSFLSRIRAQKRMHFLKLLFHIITAPWAKYQQRSIRSQELTLS